MRTYLYENWVVLHFLDKFSTPNSLIEMWRSLANERSALEVILKILTGSDGLYFRVGLDNHRAKKCKGSVRSPVVLMRTRYNASLTSHKWCIYSMTRGWPVTDMLISDVSVKQWRITCNMSVRRRPCVIQWMRHLWHVSDPSKTPELRNLLLWILCGFSFERRFVMVLLTKCVLLTLVTV